MGRKAAAASAFLFLFFSATIAIGQSSPDAARTAEDKQIDAAAKYGPADIQLHDEAVLHLPKGNVFVPQKEAAILMRRMGNFTNDHFLGLVFPTDHAQKWFVDVSFDDSGYVKDDEGKDIDADALLQKLKDGTAEDNKRRHDQGIKEIELVGWIEKPHYDPISHHLVWSMELRDAGSQAGAETGVNYNTYALGRHGYITMDLVTSKSVVEGNKAYVRTLLSDLAFKQGSRYGDFNVSTDKVAEYGLLALIGGVAVKKLGLLALMGVFFVKFAKIIAAAAIGGFAAFRKFFRKKNDAVDMRTVPAAPPPQDPPSIVS